MNRDTGIERIQQLKGMVQSYARTAVSLRFFCVKPLDKNALNTVVDLLEAEYNKLSEI